MTCRICSRRRMGFSLVELLAVVGIIALLIAILVPSLNAVRTKAKSAATLNTIRVLETAVETFKADMVVGGAYPESAALPTASPHVPGATIEPSGASLLLWALIGADGLGTPGFRDLDGDNNWRNDTTCNAAKPGLYDITNNQPDRTRAGPFVSPESVKMAQLKRPPNPATPPTPGQYFIERYSTPPISTTCFLDAFDRPILYYRANPAGNAVGGIKAGNAIYDLYDNHIFTGLDGGPGMNLGAGLVHDISRLGTFPSLGAEPTKPSFAHTIWDPKATAVNRPQRPDSYILLSPGPEGKWGTADDIGNININK
ncbi:MAG: hypothetical protein GX616_13495 [Planctomycetes bacterium]|nr:hypothetical protein [Planctomycetota bacterium]